MRRRCNIVLTRYREKKTTQDEALKEIFQLMKYPDAAKVRASEFQRFVDAIMRPEAPPVDPELEAAIFNSWKGQ